MLLLSDKLNKLKSDIDEDNDENLALRILYERIKANVYKYTLSIKGFAKSGKTTLINGLISARILPTSPINTSYHLICIQYHETYAEPVLYETTLDKVYNSDLKYFYTKDEDLKYITKGVDSIFCHLKKVIYITDDSPNISFDPNPNTSHDKVYIIRMRIRWLEQYIPKESLNLIQFIDLTPLCSYCEIFDWTYGLSDNREHIGDIFVMEASQCRDQNIINIINKVINNECRIECIFFNKVDKINPSDYGIKLDKEVTTYSNFIHEILFHSSKLAKMMTEYYPSYISNLPFIKNNLSQQSDLLHHTNQLNIIFGSALDLQTCIMIINYLNENDRVKKKALLKTFFTYILDYLDLSKTHIVYQLKADYDKYLKDLIEAHKGLIKLDPFIEEFKTNLARQMCVKVNKIKEDVRVKLKDQQKCGDDEENDLDLMMTNESNSNQVFLALKSKTEEHLNTLDMLIMNFEACIRQTIKDNRGLLELKGLQVNSPFKCEEIADPQKELTCIIDLKHQLELFASKYANSIEEYTQSLIHYHNQHHHPYHPHHHDDLHSSHSPLVNIEKTLDLYMKIIKVYQIGQDFLHSITENLKILGIKLDHSRCSSRIESSINIIYGIINQITQDNTKLGIKTLDSTLARFLNQHIKASKKAFSYLQCLKEEVEKENRRRRRRKRGEEREESENEEKKDRKEKDKDKKENERKEKEVQKEKEKEKEKGMEMDKESNEDFESENKNMSKNSNENER